MKSVKRLTAFLTVILIAVSCKDDGSAPASGSECYFFQESFSFNVSSNPEIEIPVVRLGTSGDVTVSVSSTGTSIFSVPSQVTIKDGERIGNLVVTYDKSRLEFNEVYELEISISGYSSLFGYGKALAAIEYPTSYYEYGKGTIEEGWWGEQEDKVMYTATTPRMSFSAISLTAGDTTAEPVMMSRITCFTGTPRPTKSMSRFSIWGQQGATR